MATNRNQMRVADLTDEPVAHRRRRSSRVVVVALACLVVASIPVTVKVADRDHAPSRRVVKTIGPDEARANVLAGLDASFAAQNFNFTSEMSQTAASRDTRGVGMTLAAHGTINLDPLAMVSTANVGQYGEITTWVNATTIWEHGGGQYGMAGPDNGPGAPLSGFADLVVSTLGPREGAVAMMSLASPTGYLNLARQAIASASDQGSAVTSDGVTVHEYEVTLDAGQLVNRPGMSDEQVTASTEAFALLSKQGYTNTTIRVGIDDDGLIRESASMVHFTDGGSVNAIVTFSAFGCAGTITFPGDATTSTTTPSCD